MGNITTVEGDFFIKPDLNAEQIRQFPSMVSAEIQLIIEESEEETPRGYTVTQTSCCLAAIYSTGKHYNLARQLTEVAETYGSDHVFDGYLEVTDEDGDKKRYYIRGTEVIVIKPTVTWDEPA